MLLDAAIATAALLGALLTRPWRLLRYRIARDGSHTTTPLLTPRLATLVLLPWLWALPTLHAMPLQLQWSGACLVVLMLGWPLAMPVLALVAAIAMLISPMDAAQALAAAAWQGVVPGTLEAIGYDAAGKVFLSTTSEW